MNISRRSLLAAGLAAAGSVGLAACGSSGSSDSTDETADDGSYTLVEEGKLIVASDLANPPLDYVDEDNNYVGFEVDLADAVASKLGLEMEYLSPMKFDAIIPLIKQGGKADIGVSNFTITDERKEEIDFTDPYLDSNQGLVTRADSDATTEDDLNNADVKVAVQSGTTSESWAKENLPNATVVTLDDPVQGLAGVQTGLYDAAMGDLPVMSYLVTSSYTDLTLALEIPTGEQYGIVVSKDNPNLTAAINEALAELDSEGTLADLEVTWFGSEL